MTDESAFLTAAAVIGGAVVVLGVLQHLLHLAELGLATVSLWGRPTVRASSHLWRRYSDEAPAISVMAPAYNEALNIVESVRSLLNLAYPQFEVIVVNDGSTDATLEALIQAFDLRPTRRAYQNATPCAPIRGIYTAARQPRLVVVDKENGGKADALNAAINIARSPLVCTIDADSLLESDALLRAAQPFIEDPERMIAVGGSIRIANGCRINHGRLVSTGLPRNLLALFQTIEYLRAFLIARTASSRLDTLTIISGAFGLFDRQALLKVGGYSHGTVGEDMELVIKLHRWFRERRRPYRITFIPEPMCWTEAPESLAVLARQRQRWSRGSLETYVRHWRMTANSRYGAVGWIGMSRVLLTDVLGPLVEFLGYSLLPLLCIMGLLSWSYFAAFLAVSIGFGIAVSIGGLALAEAQLRRLEKTSDLVLLALVAVLENFGYRQLCMIWRVQGLWQFVIGDKSWGVMTRKGFAAGGRRS
jgi:cellulose synthase/poly-beta-1,6-N-acetylglucosamine synthase-like glycosyltransferase